MPRAKKKAAANPRRKAPAKKGAPGKRGKRGRRGNVITVDFTDVESGGGMVTPDGPYTAEVKTAEMEVSAEGNDYIAVRWKTHVGSTVFDNFSLLPQSLWVLRTALECMGYDVPDAEYQFDPDDLVGQTCGIDVTNEEYQNRDRPKVTGYMPIDVAESMLAGDEGEEEEEEEPEDEDVEDEEEEEDEDEGEEEEEEEEPAPKKRKAKAKAPKKKAAKKKSAALRPGARVVFLDEDGEETGGVIEGIDGDIATVVDDEEGEWEIPVSELTKD